MLTSNNPPFLPLRMRAEGNAPLLRPPQVVVYPEGEGGSPRHAMERRQKLYLEILNSASS